MMYYDYLMKTGAIFIVNILRTALLKRVMDMFLSTGEREQKIFRLAFVVYYLVTSVIYSIFGLSAVYELCSLAAMAFAAFFYRDAWKKRLWTLAAFLCMDMGCSLAVYYTFLNVGELQQISAQVLLLLICVTLAGQIFGPADNKDIVFERKQMLLLILIPVISTAAFVCMMYGNVGGFAAVFLCVAIVVLNLCVFYLYHILLRNYGQLREQDIYKQQTAAYQNQLEVIMESQSRIRALKHDMKNHILTLRGLAKGSQQERLLEYLDSMQEFMVNPSEHVYTKNEALDSLLNYKIQRAEEVLRSIETDIVIPEQMKLHSFDLNVVLGNLLDNAVAAAEQTEERLLRFSMRMEKGILFLRVINSCADIPDGACDPGKLAERSACGHGTGLSNVRRIVEKYHGEMDMSCEAHQMKTELMLYMKTL